MHLFQYFSTLIFSAQNLNIINKIGILKKRWNYVRKLANLSSSQIAFSSSSSSTLLILDTDAEDLQSSRSCQPTEKNIWQYFEEKRGNKNCCSGNEQSNATGPVEHFWSRFAVIPELPSNRPQKQDKCLPYFRGNYSFLIPKVTVHKNAETICGNTVCIKTFKKL